MNDIFSISNFKYGSSKSTFLSQILETIGQKRASSLLTIKPVSAAFGLAIMHNIHSDKNLVGFTFNALEYRDHRIIFERYITDGSGNIIPIEKKERETESNTPEGIYFELQLCIKRWNVRNPYFFITRNEIFINDHLFFELNKWTDLVPNVNYSGYIMPNNIEGILKAISSIYIFKDIKYVPNVILGIDDTLECVIFENVSFIKENWIDNFKVFYQNVITLSKKEFEKILYSILTIPSQIFIVLTTPYENIIAPLFPRDINIIYRNLIFGSSKRNLTHNFNKVKRFIESYDPKAIQFSEIIYLDNIIKLILNADGFKLIDINELDIKELLLFMAASNYLEYTHPPPFKNKIATLRIKDLIPYERLMMLSDLKISIQSTRILEPLVSSDEIVPISRFTSIIARKDTNINSILQLKNKFPKLNVNITENYAYSSASFGIVSLLSKIKSENDMYVYIVEYTFQNIIFRKYSSQLEEEFIIIPEFNFYTNDPVDVKHELQFLIYKLGWNNNVIYIYAKEILGLEWLSKAHIAFEFFIPWGVHLFEKYTHGFFMPSGVESILENIAMQVMYGNKQNFKIPFATFKNNGLTVAIVKIPFKDIKLYEWKDSCKVLNYSVISNDPLFLNKYTTEDTIALQAGFLIKFSDLPESFLPRDINVSYHNKDQLITFSTFKRKFRKLYMEDSEYTKDIVELILDIDGFKSINIDSLTVEGCLRYLYACQHLEAESERFENKLNNLLLDSPITKLNKNSQLIDFLLSHGWKFNVF